MKKSYLISIFLASLLCTGLIQARTQTTLDYQSRIHPEIASDFMVVTQNKHATEVGYDILRKGGNAVDASVAVGFAFLHFGSCIFSELDLILMLRASVLVPATIFSEYGSL